MGSYDWVAVTHTVYILAFFLALHFAVLNRQLRFVHQMMRKRTKNVAVTLPSGNSASNKLI